MIFFKFIARFLGRRIPYFKGKNLLIRFLYNPKRFKNIHSGEKFITDYFGLKYEGITSNYIDWGVYFYGGHEKALVNYLIKQVNTDIFDYYFDIGANTGTLSLPIAKIKKTKIISFEPLSYNFNRLVNNYKINNLFNDHIFHNLALSDTRDQKNIHYSEATENIGTSSLLKLKEIKDDQIEKINTETLDSLYDFKDKKILIKIDVEGYENFVIDGAYNLLKNNKILMYIETDNINLLNKLEAIGYKKYFFNLGENTFKVSNIISGKDVILQNF